MELAKNIHANEFASTFYFFSTHNATTEKNIKSLQATAPNSADICTRLTRHSNGVTETRINNSRLASCGVTCLNSSVVLLLGFSGKLTVKCSEIPHERQAANR